MSEDKQNNEGGENEDIKKKTKNAENHKELYCQGKKN